MGRTNLREPDRSWLRAEQTFAERIEPGAFADFLRRVRRGDRRVFALWDHEFKRELASTQDGNLWLAERSNGLWFQMETHRLRPEEANAVRAGKVLVSIGISAVQRQAWGWAQSPPLRTLAQLEILEISLVPEAAFRETFVREVTGRPGHAPRRWQQEAAELAVRT